MKRAQWLVGSVLGLGVLFVDPSSAVMSGSPVLVPSSLVRSAEASIVERVVAIVGEHAILLSDLRDRARPFLLRVYASVPEGPQRAAAITQVYEVVLQRMVEEELEDVAANRAGIVVTAQEIDEAMRRVAAQNQLSVQSILAEAKRSGMSTQQYRDELRRQVLQAKLVNLRLQGRIRVTDSDLVTAYRRFQSEERLQVPQRVLRLEIPLAPTEAAQAAQLAHAEDLVRRVRAGEDFATLIEREPPAPGTGYSEPRPPSQEAAPIQRALLALDVGEISRPIRVDGSLVVFQVVERPPSELPPFEEAREAIHQRVYMEKMAKAREHWIAGLKRRTHVEIRM